MSSQELAKTEEVLRAILETDYDKAKNRYSSSLFMGGDVSLSRLAIKPFDEIVEIFLTDLDKPNRAVIGTGLISVGELINIGLAYKAKPTTISVLPKPTELNPAHAEMPQKVPRGLALEIISKLKMKEIQRKSNRWDFLRLIMRWFKTR